MAAILKNDRKMPFYQRKKFNPMFFCLFIPLTCIINEKINLPKKIPRHYISARSIITKAANCEQQNHHCFICHKAYAKCMSIWYTFVGFCLNLQNRYQGVIAYG